MTKWIVGNYRSLHVDCRKLVILGFQAINIDRQECCLFATRLENDVLVDLSAKSGAKQLAFFYRAFH